MGAYTPLLILALLGCAASCATAATCITGTTNFILTSDITTPANNIGANNLNPPLDDPLAIPHLSERTFNEGTAVFCVTNEFLFENTHVALSDIAFGLNDIASQCCPGESCQGGTFTITGDTGLSVILSVQPGGTSCT